MEDVLKDSEGVEIGGSYQNKRVKLNRSIGFQEPEQPLYAARVVKEELTHRLTEFLSVSDKRLLLRQYELEMRKLGEGQVIVRDFTSGFSQIRNFGEWIAAHFIRADERLELIRGLPDMDSYKRLLYKCRNIFRIAGLYLESAKRMYKIGIPNEAERAYNRIVAGKRAYDYGPNGPASSQETFRYKPRR